MQKLGKCSLAAAGLTVLASCQQQAPEQPTVNQPAVEAPASRLPKIEPPVDRAGLLQAARAAASAAALGRDDAEVQRKLDGKAFEVRIRFGCAPAGPAEEAAAEGPFNVRFEPDERTLRVRAAPDLTLDDPQVAQIAGEGIEAVEGFWMRRPWLLADGCPVAPVQAQAPGAGEPAAPEAAAAPPAGQRVGIAQFFSATDSRVGRRNQRAYEATSTLGAAEQPSPKGYNLVLSGRLRKLPSGPVISCRVGNRESPPDCIVSAEFDRAWIENPGTRAIIAEWSS